MANFTQDPSAKCLTPSGVARLAPFYALIVAVFFFYGNIYDNSFLYDDRYLILNNPSLRSWGSAVGLFFHHSDQAATHAGHFYRPLQNLLYLIVYQWSGGASLFAFHLLNISLHAANACWVYLLGRKLGFRASGTFFAALIWELHPIQTEAVTYMSDTHDLLSSFFCLCGMIVLLPDFARGRIFLSLPLFVLGLLSKEGAIVFPVLAMCCFYLHHPNRLKIRGYVAMWPLWAVTVFYLLVRFVFFHDTDIRAIGSMSQIYSTHFSLRLYTFLATVPVYGGLLLWPSGLHMDWNIPISYDVWNVASLSGILLIASAAGQVIWGRGRKGLPLSWGLLWYACAQVPQTGLLVPTDAIFYEQWMYLPSVGLFLGVAETALLSLHNPKIKMALGTFAAALSLVCGALTYRQNAVWHDPVTFYNNIIDQGGISMRAHNNLGLYYMGEGEDAKAILEYQLGIQASDLIPEPHMALALLLSKNLDGDVHTRAQIAELQRAAEIDPDYWPAYQALTSLYLLQGDKEKADFYRRKVEEIQSRQR